jgi:hypothetical protein
MRITDFAILNEIKEEYQQLRRTGKNRTTATEELTKSYNSELTIGENEDGIFFWVGLADAQYSLKELESSVADRALWALDKIEEHHFPIVSGDISKRRTNYAKAPMKERVRIGEKSRYRCTWQIGDTFAYQLTEGKAEEMGIAGKYILLRKVDELEPGDGRVLPVVTLSFWEQDTLPTTLDQYLRTPLLKLSSERLGFPKGFYEYRAEIMFKNKKQLENMIYLGRFSDITMPSDEVVIQIPGYMLMLIPERFSNQCCTFIKMHRHYSSI